MMAKEYKVFLSSSNSLLKHREIVKTVVDELNDTVSKFSDGRLSLFRWEKETNPQMGRPQEVIFKQSAFQQMDIYIGLIGRYLGPGTKEEFDEAYSSFKMSGKPEIMMFQDISPLTGESINIEQINKAQQFIDGFKEGGEHPGLIITYKNTRELEKKVRRSLTEFMLRRTESARDGILSGIPSYAERMVSAGITNFYVGRDEWQMYRDPPRLSDYLLTAQKSVKIATYWLAQGSIEGVINIYQKLIDRGVSVEVVTIEPADDIAKTLSRDVNEMPESIKTYVTLALNKLNHLRNELPEDKKELFSVRVSKVIPQAAVIFMDGGTPNGKIQLEFRPYGVPRNDSFSIEVSSAKNAKLYDLLEESWERFFDDAEPFIAE